MVQPKDWDMDVATSLREMAANADEITGKILKKSQDAANKGAFHIEHKISEEDYNYLSNRDRGVPRVGPPYIEKLESLGFKLDYDSRETLWSKFKQGMDYCFRKSYNYYLIVKW